MDYQHGGDIYSQEILWDFSVNVNPLGPPERVKEALRQSAEYCNCYPDIQCRDLVKAIIDHIQIAYHFPLAQGDVLCGNGAADLLYQIMFALKPKYGILPVPVFSEYAQALQAAGGRVWTLISSRESGFSLDIHRLEMEVALHEEQGKKPEILCLCNPNNPTGKVLSQRELIYLAEYTKKKNMVFLLDECFMDFLNCPEEYSMIPYIQEFQHLIIVKAFTKIYAIPGLRLGFCLTKNHSLLEKIRTLRQPWSVSIPAQMAGIAALKEEVYIQQTRKIIVEGREQLSQGLSRLGFVVYPSEANYILFQDVREGAERGILYRACREKKLLLRSCGNFEGLDDSYYRVCIKTKEENERLLVMLREEYIG